MPRLLSVVLLIAGCVPTMGVASEPAAERLLIAFASLRTDGLHPTVLFYEHDGKDSGKIVGKVAPGKQRSDHHPALSRDGKLCVFAAEVVAKPCTVECWNRDTEELVDLSSLKKSPNAQMAPAIGGSGVICFEAWNRPDSPGRWDLLLYDLEQRELLPSPAVNTSQFDERKAALSGNGQWLAFTTNANTRERLSEIALFDRDSGQPVALPNLNTRYMETEPSISHDGQVIAFVTDRPGGQGARDIGVYDRQATDMVVVPGLNSVGQEQSPAISPNGRYIAFVSERLEGVGERDIYLYDRGTSRLLPTPGLNSIRDEYDPTVVVLNSSP